MTLPPSLVPAASALSARRSVAVCPPLSADADHPVGDIGDGVAVGVDLELVERLGREGFGGRRSGRAKAGGRVHVHDQDRLARISRLGESIEIGEVEAGVPAGEAEVETGIVMRHEKILLRETLK